MQVCNLLRKLGASTAVRKTESATALPGITPSHTAACCVYGYAGGHMLAARTEVIHRLIAVIFSRYAYNVLGHHFLVMCYFKFLYAVFCDIYC